MAHKVSAVLPSASAPDLRRSRLEKLLSQAKPTPAPSEISRTSARRSAPGGAPYPGAPPVRLATGSRQSTAARQLPSRLTSAASALRLTQQSSTPAISPSRPTEERRSQTGSSKAPELGSYIKQLVGDEKGDGMQHWRLVSEVDAIDSLMQESLERHRAAEQKAKQRHVLEEQVREAQKKDNEFKSSRMNWGSKLQADADQWQQEERSRKVLQQEMQRKFNEEQARHAEEGRRRKDEERQQVAALEHSLVQQAEIEKARQEEAEGRRRRKQQEMAKQMADAAKEAQEKKALKKHEEAQKDRPQRLRSRQILRLPHRLQVEEPGTP
ncbi:unnamed protein product [Effrenium voratum]|nr:unnamed protein product [Effrenium voratum]